MTCSHCAHAFWETLYMHRGSRVYYPTPQSPPAADSDRPLCCRSRAPTSIAFHFRRTSGAHSSRETSCLRNSRGACAVIATRIRLAVSSSNSSSNSSTAQTCRCARTGSGCTCRPRRGSRVGGVSSPACRSRCRPTSSMHSTGSDCTCHRRRRRTGRSTGR